MSVIERITEDMKLAMKSGEKLRLETIRSLRAAVIELEKSGKGEVTDEMVMAAVMNQGKRRKDAAEQFRRAGRADLAGKEEAELRIIQEYLPTQLDDEAIRSEVVAIIEGTGAKGTADFKLVMPKAMGALRGKADGGKVQTIVKEELQRIEAVS